MAKRALFADFETYTDGDAHFKNELIGLMINNLSEMQKALESSAKAGNYKEFQDSCHKSASSLNILADEEFNRSIAKLKEDGGSFEERLFFHTLCSEIIESLNAERHYQN